MKVKGIITALVSYLLVMASEVSNADLQYFTKTERGRFIVTDKMLKKAPSWNPAVDPLPLSVQKAVSLAREHIESKPRCKNYILSSISYYQHREYKDRWSYLIQYSEPHRPNIVEEYEYDFCPALILMDGTVVAPTTEPRKTKTLLVPDGYENLDDIGVVLEASVADQPKFPQYVRTIFYGRDKLGINEGHLIEPKELNDIESRFEKVSISSEKDGDGPFLYVRVHIYPVKEVISLTNETAMPNKCHEFYGLVHLLREIRSNSSEPVKERLVRIFNSKTAGQLRYLVAKRIAGKFWLDYLQPTKYQQVLSSWNAIELVGYVKDSDKTHLFYRPVSKETAYPLQLFSTKRGCGVNEQLNVAAIGRTAGSLLRETLPYLDSKYK